MRRVVILGTGLLAVGAGFCAGRASKLKFPWAGELLNRPCGKTELEWRCATKGLRRDKPVVSGIYWTITSLRAEIRRKGVVVHANVALQPTKVITKTHEALVDGCRQASFYAEEHFGHGRERGQPFTHWRNLAVYLSVDGKPAMVAVGGKFQEVTRFPK